jgi:hypothetical protein
MEGIRRIHSLFYIPYSGTEALPQFPYCISSFIRSMGVSFFATGVTADADT